MDEVDYNKILEELPSGVGSLLSGGSVGLEPNFDFASLYTSTITMKLGPRKNSIRKRKIKNVFPDIE